MKFYVLFLCSLIISLGLWPEDVAANISRQSVVIAISNDEEPTVIAKVYGEKSTSRQISLDEEGDRSKPVGALQSYYYYLKENQLDKLVGISYLDDGTRNSIKSAVDSGDFDSSQFSSVDSVAIPFRLQWGEMSVLNARWLSNGSVVGGWNEAVVCGNSCFVSDALLSDSGAIEVVSSVLNALMERGFYTGDIRSSLTFDVPPLHGNKYPISILIDFKDRAVTDTEIYPANKASEGQSAMRALVDAAVSSGESVTEAEANSILRSHFSDFDGSQLFNQYSGNNRSGFSGAYLTPYALYRLLSGLSRVDLVGEIDAGDERFVLMKATKKDKIFPLLMIFGEDNLLKQIPDNIALFQILLSRYGAEAISNYIDK